MVFFLTLILCIAAYFLGSLSSAIIASRLFKLPDPRTVGSGNPGATNILRQGKKKIALAVLLGDLLKGWFPVFIGGLIGIPISGIAWIGLAAFIGHLFPIYFEFKGGKGVATGLGIILALAWPVAIIVALIWIIVAGVSRYSSLAALIATASFPFVYSFEHAFSLIWLPMIIMIALLFWKHKPNIQRLIQGKETKIKLSKK